MNRLGHLKINVVHIKDDWDTSKWSFNKLIQFYINCYCKIESKNMDEVKELTENTKWLAQYIDVSFLEALSWNNES